MSFKEIPETKVKLKEVKDLYNAGYEVLSELRNEVNAPVVKASLLNQEIIAVYGQNAAKKNSMTLITLNVIVLCLRLF